MVGTRPELLREALGQGEAWGLHLTWHLVKDAGEEVRVLRQLRIRSHQRVLIGRAHRVLSPEAFARLGQAGATVSSGANGHRSTWAGWASWASLSAESLGALKDGLSGEDVDSAIRRVAGRRLALRPGDVATADSARHLLAAQAHALRGELWRELSDPVIPMPWGAMSPRAHVSPLARIQGPVWIGPGCTVGPRAELAANSVLTRDVMVAADTRMDNALILPETLIGRQLDLVNVIANGCSIQHVALGERIELRESDAVLSRLHAGVGAAGLSRLVGRTLAAAMLPVLAPALGLVALTRWLRGQDALPWINASAVSRSDPQSGVQKHVQLRLARDGLGGFGMAAAAWGALLDILQGRRCWMGPRPRKAAEWACLPNEWQAALGSMPIGWLHMENWTDSVITAAESRAAADLMWLAPPRGWKRLAFVVRALPRAVMPSMPRSHVVF